MRCPLEIRSAPVLLLAAAAFTFMPGPAAQGQDVEADLDIYGSFRIGPGWLDNGEGDLNVFDRASRVGIRGTFTPTEEGSGFLPEIYWQVESGVQLDRGTGTLANRDSYVGIRDEWGSVRVGFFETPGREAGRAAERIFSRVGDQRNITRLDDARGGQDAREPGWDNRWGSSLRYETPRFRGFALHAQLSSHYGEEGFVNATRAAGALSARVTYDEGPWEVAAAFETIDGDAPRLPSHEAAPKLFRLSGIYSADGFEASGLLQHAADQQGVEGQDRTTFGGGASYAVNDRTRLHGQAYHAGEADNLEESSATMLAAELEYRVYENARVYFSLAQAANDDEARFQSARGVIPDGEPGDNSTSASVLFRYDF